jgi:hypothetical protein
MDKPVDERGGMDWLGPEFLTWMWWRASVDPEFLRKDGSSVYVHVDEFLELKGERAAARKTTLRAGMPGASAEGKVALRNGKVVTRPPAARPRRGETRLTLRAEDFDLSAVRAARHRDQRASTSAWAPPCRPSAACTRTSTSASRRSSRCDAPSAGTPSS